MAGHSKWANIQHRKGAQDKKRGKIFTKLIREITVAARVGGGDADSNPRLRLAMDKAMSHNMPKDNIERAIKRGAGGLDGEVLEELTYEGYGTNGVALLVKCVTDNRNRTVASVRHAFNKCGGSLGTDGSVAYLFSQQGQITFPPESDEEKIMEAALEAGAEDIAVNTDGSIDVIATPENFENTKKAMQAARLESVHAEITMASAVKITLDKDNSEKLLKMIEMLEDLDDVQEVFSNADISEEILQDAE